MSVVMQGFTREEIREFMHQYYLQPHGTKRAWLEAQQVPVWRVQQWRKLVYEGDLDRNLIPRDHGSMTRTYGELSAFEKNVLRRSLIIRQKLNSSRIVSVSLKDQTRPWEKLSGSCTT